MERRSGTNIRNKKNIFPWTFVRETVKVQRGMKIAGLLLQEDATEASLIWIFLKIPAPQLNSGNRACEKLGYFFD